MTHNQSMIAYTIIAKNRYNELSFLVGTDEDDYYFPHTEQLVGHTGLATALEALKQIVELDFDRLELAELTNIVVHESRVPFFVFSYTASHQLDDLVRPQSELTWASYAHLKDDLKEWNFTGVPLFR